MSNYDKNIGITIPREIDDKLSEETGIHIGDGSMNYYNGCGTYSLRGHKVDDKEYYEKFIPTLYKQIYNFDVHIRKWPDVIGFQKGSKAIIAFKHKILHLPLGKKLDIKIPTVILKNSELVTACLRGLFDTDGCIFLEKKPPTFYYPRIIIKSTSKPLIIQVKNCLENMLDFNLCYRVNRRIDMNWKDLHIIEIRGFNNIEKWLRVVGTNNPKHRKKIEFCLTKRPRKECRTDCLNGTC